MNADLIEQFVTLQNYYRYEGDKGRTIAYGKIVAILKTIDTKITRSAQLRGIRGIGPKVIQKVQEYLQTGKINAAIIAKAELLAEKKLSKKEKILDKLATVWGIGPVKAQKLYDAGVRSVPDLRNRLDLLTNQQKIGLKYHEDLQKKIPRLTITALEVIMRTYLNKRYGKNSYLMEIAGSYRRGATESGDIDCIISSDMFTLRDVVALFREKNIITDTLSLRTEKFMGIVHCPGGGLYIRLDIEFVTEEEWGTALLYFTGSKGYNMYMRAEAKRKGLLLNEHGLYNMKGERVLRYPTEEDVHKAIGMKYIKPEMR